MDAANPPELRCSVCGKAFAEGEGRYWNRDQAICVPCADTCGLCRDCEDLRFLPQPPLTGDMPHRCPREEAERRDESETA